MADRLAPAFQFYANDWLADINVTMMSPAQEGAYIRLLCYAWKDPDCSLPDDDDQLAILSRLGEGWLKGGSTVVRKCFNQSGSRLVHEGLKEIRNKHLEWSNKSREGGIKSGAARRLRSVKGGSQMVEPNGNLSSSSSNKSNNYKRVVNSNSSFTPPKLDEVKRYCEERNNGINAQQFIDYYEARGWSYGKGAKMKSWRAAVRTWESNGHHVNGKTQRSIPQLETIKRY